MAIHLKSLASLPTSPVSFASSPSSAHRWHIALLVSAAIAISYLDRQTLPIAIGEIRNEIPISNSVKAFLDSAFLLTYGLMYVGGGRLMDVLGTRRGFLIIMVFWSLACASHGFAGGVIAPSLIAAIILNVHWLGGSSWRWVFFITGALGILWTVWWSNPTTLLRPKVGGHVPVPALPPPSRCANFSASAKRGA